MNWIWTPFSAAKHRGMLASVLSKCESLKRETDEALRSAAVQVRWRAQTGTPLKNLLVDAFSLAREASRRTVKMEHFPVQVLGGIQLFEGGIAEMQTGEGKTLTAVLPAFLRALAGQGCHVVTVNDYLAERDAEEMGPIYRFLGLEVGCVLASMKNPPARRAAYAADITYGTAKEFGFDFLRDRLARGADAAEVEITPRVFGSSAPGGGVQRGHYFALVDEVDSVLLDEARTPLIIAQAEPNPPDVVNMYRWCDRVSQQLKHGDDFILGPAPLQARLTKTGRRAVLLTPQSVMLETVQQEEILRHMEQALVARFRLALGRHYVVHKNKEGEDEVMIVDESTGRKLDGRKWQNGLHQAVEAKEGVPITAGTGQSAQVTIQTYFRRYEHLAGMSGTAASARGEFRRTFKLRVQVIPTHRTCIRRSTGLAIYKTMADKVRAIVDATQKQLTAGRSLLIGTPSVAASLRLSEQFRERGIEHQVLNALNDAREAEIVKDAGEARRVTIATNMAGRGTDIRLSDAVRQSGGLHVIATEMHSSKRIDRQLVGRAARQGDPGSYEFLLSLEDELFATLPRDLLKSWSDSAKPASNGQIAGSWLTMFRWMQARLERDGVKQRRELLKMEKRRLEQFREMGLDPFLELTS